MTPSDKFNPAENLHRLLKNAGGHHDEQVYPVWARLLAATHSEDVFLDRFHELRKLNQDAVSSIKAIPQINHSLFLRWAEPVNQALSLNMLSHRWSEVSSILKESVLQALEFSADTLSMHHLETAIPIATLEELARRAKDLREQLQGIDIPADLKSLLEKHLNNFLEVARSYEIRGIEAVDITFSSALGDVIIAREKFHNQQTKAEVREFLDILWKGIELISTATHLHTLADGVRGLLGA